VKSLKLILALLSLLIVTLIFTTNSNEQKLSSKPLITTSNFAIFDVIQHIGGDKIELVNIIPFGVDPHSFEPTPKVVAKLEKSDFFFYSGDILEPWADHLSLEAKGVDLSQYVSLRKFDDEDEHEDHEDEHHHDHGAYDPHYWLDVDNMKQIAQVITEKLSMLEPKNKHLFEKNKLAYIKSLEQLDDLYKESLLSCKQDTIVVTHNAFSYLAQRYDFKVESLTGLSTDAQPSAKDVQHIFQEIQDKNISVVFFENFSSSKNIQTIADDLSIEVDSLQPLGNITADEKDQNLSYEDLMKINLEKIAKALQCN
jgi:zinc transport system substrate-binding protein